MEQSNKLKEVLQEIGMTQMELSRLAKVSIATISKAVNHKRNPSVTLQSKLIRAINKYWTEKAFTRDEIFY